MHELLLGQAIAITDANISKFIREAEHVRSLSLSGMTAVVYPVISHMNLDSLAIEDCNMLTTLTLDLPSLHSLTIRACCSLTDDGLLSAYAGCPMLDKLDVSAADSLLQPQIAQ